MKANLFIATLVLGCVLYACPASALETSIAYQGVLRDETNGILTTKTQMIDFRLYTVATGGEALWGRKITVQLSGEGLFNVELSGTAGSPLSGTSYTNLVDALKSARSNTALFIGLTVQSSSGEIAPRQKLMMVPYASYAADADTASGSFTVSGKATLGSAKVLSDMTVDGPSTLTGNVTAGGTITAAKNITVQATGTFVGYGTIPVGGIIMWSGTTVPEGWALCNGSTVNGITTPNLIDRFIYGASQAGGTGGASGVTLGIANLPSHYHLYAGDDMIEGLDSACTTKERLTSNHYDAESHDSGNSKVFRTSTTGSASPTAVTIMPPYYKLAFIMRVK